MIANLGTPSAPTEAGVRDFLARFLDDPRVIPLPGPARRALLSLAVLPRRPRRVAPAYARVWDEARGASPLLALTWCAAARLAERLEPEGTPVACGMRYGEPSLERALRSLAARGARRAVVVGLYPQRAGATSMSLEDETARLARVLPTAHAPDWHDHPLYIEALAGSLARALRGRAAPDAALVSFHGIPVRADRAGDPYRARCETTFRLLEAALRARGFAAPALLSWQSRFGPAKWLEPFTIDEARRLPGAGMRRVALIAPGFSVDCLETLEELREECRDAFLEAGGEEWTTVPCLNADPAHIDLLEAVAKTALSKTTEGRFQ